MENAKAKAKLFNQATYQGDKDVKSCFNYWESIDKVKAPIKHNIYIEI